MIDVRQILIGLPVRLFGYLVYLIFPPPDQTHIPYKNSIRIIIQDVLPDFSVKIANSLSFLIQIFSFIFITNLKRILRRKILKFKSASIFAVFVFFNSILFVNGNYNHLVNNVYHNGSLICDKVFDNADSDSDLLIYDEYLIPSNNYIIFASSTKGNFLNPYFLTCKNCTRAPPS